jgi:hypothetical protein
MHVKTTRDLNLYNKKVYIFLYDKTKYMSILRDKKISSLIKKETKILIKFLKNKLIQFL